MATLGMGDVLSLCSGAYLARKQDGIGNILWKTMEAVKTFLVVESCDFSGIL